MAIESIEELRVFVQVLESGSMTAAARVLGLSTNTVSRRLASLERGMGVKLLHRTTRSNRPSEEGAALHQRALRILAEVDAAQTELSRVRGSLSGMLRICVPSLMLRLGMLHALSELLQSHPDLRMQLRVSDRTLHPITEGLDLAIQAGDLVESGLVARKLVEAGPVMAASSDYARRHGVPHTPQELSQHATLRFLSERPQAHWILHDAQGQEHVVPVTGAFESDDSRALNYALYAGLGVGLITPLELQRGTASGELVQALPGYRMAPFRLYAVYPASQRGSAKLQALVATLQAFFTNTFTLKTQARPGE